MRSFVIALTLALAAVVAGSASAGGWATIGFEPLPDGTAAGISWKPKIFIKQHGVRPLEGLHPVVAITQTSSGRSESFAAQSTSEVGVYEADVIFPTPGDWLVAIDSGFGESRTEYGPVTIGTGVASEPGSFPTRPVGVVAIALALAVAGALGIRRFRKLTPASD